MDVPSGSGEALDDIKQNLESAWQQLHAKQTVGDADLELHVAMGFSWCWPADQTESPCVA